jgi:anti-anti-sigma regulatory factor
MLKITREQMSGKEVVLKLEGRLVGPWVEHLQDICEPILQAGLKLTLDLEHVSFADRGGVRLLARLRSRVQMARCSRVVKEQLR